MRNILFVVLATTAACAAHSYRTTTPGVYACGDLAVVRNGTEVTGSTPELLGRLTWRDSAGNHFVRGPLSPTDREAIEFVIPDDPMQDGVQRTYDTTSGSSPANWRLTSKQVCVARGGYNDVLARYLKGESLDELAHSLALDSRDEARLLVRRAMVTLQRRYYRDL